MWKWMQVPGNNKGPVRLAAVWTLIGLFLASQPAWGKDSAKAQKEEKAPAPAAAAPAPAPEVSFIGKFSCPLKRAVILPFQGIITSLQVQAGQKVKKGEVLARFHLTPEASLQLQRRLHPPQVKELEVKLAEVERGLTQATARRREVQELAAKKLASPQGLAQAEKEWQLLSRERQAIQAQLNQEKRLAADNILVLQEQMGYMPGYGQGTREAVLKAPIDGYVLSVHPDLRKNAELNGNAVAFLVGVMDPLVVKAQVHEMEALQVKVGDLADIQPESLPGRTFEAKVSRLSWFPLKAGLDQPTYYEAEFEVPNPDLILKDGMKVRIVLRQPRNK